MKRNLIAVLRRILRGVGVDLVHYDEDPLLRELMQARETLRVSPHLSSGKRDQLLAHVASRGHLRNLLHELAIDLVIDVGANKGQFAQGLREIGYTGRIISFEPLAAGHAALTALARVDPALEIYQLALGDEVAELSLNVSRDAVFSSFHAASQHGLNRFGDLLAIDHTERVLIRPLDSLAGSLNIPENARILFKTDTQGHDLAVLRGARGVLTRTLAMVIEAPLAQIYEGAPHHEEIARWLAAAGFKPSGMYPISHDHDLTLIEMDCYFVRPGLIVP